MRMNTAKINELSALLIELNMDLTEEKYFFEGKRDFESALDVQKVKDAISIILEKLDK